MVVSILKLSFGCWPGYLVGIPFITLVNKPSFMAATLYPLASLSQVEKTPSRDDGIPEDLEEDLRAYGCKLIHQAGILLNQYARTADGFPDV